MKIELWFILAGFLLTVMTVMTATAYHAGELNDHVMYIEQEVSEIKQDVKDLGWDLKDIDKSIHKIDLRLTRVEEALNGSYKQGAKR